ncbi:pyruvate formate lyase activating enzyme [Saccharicrinis carchari]|uniref:Pyruvate formate lyase activating enzyme n=1 Tax=Saccharicrinis carchari TaxID=1168039 RepID=A0A521D523_SACCC|nr:AmmeMemoRadiSam system radical SAM enzyme [Saccharicrinis carchari]SMO66777.1 pyruvate formate lyase activating enzyme [Saccharicrinis carchari]
MTINSSKDSLPAYKIAQHWVSNDSGIRCILCPHNCFLHEDEVGICRVRANKNGQLVALSYGYACATHVDPVEKKPLYHFLPNSTTFSVSTVGCNLHCLNCQNHTISQAKFIMGDYQYVSPEQVVKLASSQNCQSIAYTYTDPVVYYEYMMDTAEIAKAKGLKNIFVSAGYIHKKPLRQLSAFIDAANIDLKCFDDDVYQRMSGARLNHVLDSLQVLLEENIWLEITNLLVPGYSDGLDRIEKMCRWLVDNGFAQVPLHFSKFYPTYKLHNLEPTSMVVLKEAYQIAKNIGIKYVYLGNVADNHYTQTVCYNCGALLVERMGYQTIIQGMDDGKCTKCGFKAKGIWQ